MKRQLLYLFVCLGLIMPGSGLLKGLNAQTKNSRRVSAVKKNPTQKKTPSAEKSTDVQRIVRGKVSGANLGGDPCNTDLPITIGQTLTESLTTSDCVLDDETLIDFYSFSGTAGQPVTISMSSNDFDTVLYLLDEAGDIIDANDDDDGTNSRIPSGGGVVILPYTGTYYLGAGEYDPAVGTYSINLTAGAGCPTTAVSFNQTVNGTLASSDCNVNFDGDLYYTDLYTFSGTAGQQISIAMNSTAVDAYLILHSPDGSPTIEDDNSGGGTNAAIPEGGGTLTLPATGIYTIEASSLDPFESGAYTLTVTGPNTPSVSKKPFDFDGDGKADLSVFRPSNGVWYLQQSTNGFAGVGFGASNDVITPADFDGDGKTDIAVFRPSNGTWYLQQSTAGFTGIQFGASGDIPMPADFDGDGKTDLAVFRPSNGVWYIQGTQSGFTGVAFGANGDVPVAADYDGDGKADVAVFRPSNGTWYLQRSQLGFTGVLFGESTDKPVPADYDGDGKTDIAVFRPSNGTWYLQQSTAGFNGVLFGANGDLPVPADYDGDGKSDVSVFRPSNGVWYLNRSTQGFTGVQFGANGDKPIPNAFIP